VGWVRVDKLSFFCKWAEFGYENWIDIVWIASILNLSDYNTDLGVGRLWLKIIDFSLLKDER
jgi:hypothetical protein